MAHISHKPPPPPPTPIGLPAKDGTILTTAPLIDASVRIEARISYKDGSSQSLAVVYEDGQNKSADRYGVTQAAFDTVWADPGARSIILAALAALGGTHTIINPPPPHSKVVVSLIFNYYGRMAHKDQNKNTWRVSYDPKGGIVTMNVASYALMRASSGGRATLVGLWQTLVGPGGSVTIV
jgi:hypothetical protein